MQQVLSFIKNRNEILDWKMRLDESDNLAARIARGVTDKVSSLLEFFAQPCTFQAYSVLSAIVSEYQKVNFSTADCRVIDVDKVEMVTGKMMEQGPVMIITFQVYMVNVIRNMEGKVVEGDPNSPVRVHHVWVMCRDMEEYNPAVAWKVLEVHMQKESLFVTKGSLERGTTFGIILETLNSSMFEIE
ncbi:unnamed protein product [Gongylonema pulchrum]|uniref:Tim44 domain-containing protein n=1 Tax=Gongylonema pulchrum TaxID=637853 RepID=A0A183DTN3_9BILA|nr:unnamed protein product [Gongylonema pulchrum]